MNISELKLVQTSHAYIKDGILKKWRFFENDPNNMLHKLHWKQKSEEPLTDGDMWYIREYHKNVIIETEGMLEFHNFTAKIDKIPIRRV